MQGEIDMTLNEAVMNREYVVKDIRSEAEELRQFLFSLGCYSGEPVKVINRKKHNLVLAIKNSRYNIDSELASAIGVVQCDQ